MTDRSKSTKEQAEPSKGAGPWGAQSVDEARLSLQQRAYDRGRITMVWSSRIFIASVCIIVAIGTYRELSKPEAWSYFSDRYFHPTMNASVVPNGYVDASGGRHLALAVNGEIGAASAGWLRDKLDEAHLVPGDAVFLSSPGGDLGQAIIMGDVVRARGPVTAVGRFDAQARVQPSFCASACIMAFAGGTTRIGIPGSKLGVHRFTSTGGDDPVADTQRTTGMVLTYLGKMGVSSALVEAMSQTAEIRWLDADEAASMKLVTRPIRD